MVVKELLISSRNFDLVFPEYIRVLYSKDNIFVMTYVTAFINIDIKIRIHYIGNELLLKTLNEYI